VLGYTATNPGAGSGHQGDGLGIAHVIPEGVLTQAISDLIPI
jgi:hypothetical protein